MPEWVQMVCTIAGLAIGLGGLVVAWVYYAAAEGPYWEVVTPALVVGGISLAVGGIALRALTRH
jgi:hypothetical protein